LRELAKLYIKTKEYEKAVQHAEKYSSIRPFDSDFLYYIAFAYKKNEKYEFALDFSERLRLRNPKHLKNLLLLAECYISLENFKKAQSTINCLLELDSGHPRAIQIAALIQEKRIIEV
jgi:tetratricopeptide (TPR) repeat protein